MKDHNRKSRGCQKTCQYQRNSTILGNRIATALPDTYYAITSPTAP